MANIIKILLIFCALICSIQCYHHYHHHHHQWSDGAEGSPCVTKGVNGTCVSVLKCNSAALTYLYREAGYANVDLPELPDICSVKNNQPVVCCTDCDLDNPKYASSAVGPGVLLVSKKGPVAHAKCYEYFDRLPYSCRGRGGVNVYKDWDEQHKCHVSSYIVVGTFVVGGRDAQKWEFPHMALLGYGAAATTAQWRCGGSVISERYILTAAHCSYTRALGPITFAALGLLKRTDPKQNWKVYKIQNIIVHPEYRSPAKYHDIALLQTDTEIQFGVDLLPACLGVVPQGPRQAEVSGWGRRGHREGLADHLQAVNLEQFSAQECDAMYPVHRHLRRGYDHRTQMCYGSKTEVVDTCEGDSGGPLQTSDEKCLYTVVGVTSYGRSCGQRGAAGMYTRVQHYVPWIESVVWPGEVNIYN
ncbi:venom protease-like [Anticarsia gemmatalis]|uniref:venom protease-like n=1 Tax=Anticarsia gemmatalis TaxID=129554 RepID=UPI003F76D971